MTVQLRVWQREALRSYGEGLIRGERSALWEATPGAGKTTAALHLCLHQIRRMRAKRLVIVVPTAHLKRQWARSASLLGFELDSHFTGKRTELSRDYQGVAITYQQIGNRVKFFEEFARDAVVILDEVHHAGDGLSWGDALRSAFSNAKFVLCLSGTAFRSDNNAIPFVRYDADGTSMPDYTYSYSRAVEEAVCRPSAFFTYGGDVGWSEHEREVVANFNDALDNQTSARRLRAALDPASGWIEPMLEDAHAMLMRVRLEQPDAGGLLVAADQDHARQLAEILAVISKSKPTVVLSDDSEAARKLKTYGGSSSLWLIACNMVSEGVDIPRLRVGVYATTVRTKMYFRQMLGRIIRRTPSPSGLQVAYCYLPADPRLRRLAEEVESEARHYLNRPREREDDDRDDRNRNRVSDENEKGWEALPAVNSGVDAVIVHGSQLSLFGVGSGPAVEQVVQAVHRKVEVRLEEQRTKSEEKALLAATIKRLVGLYHRQTGEPHSSIHLRLSRKQGIRSQAHCTEDQLRERVQLLEELLRTGRKAA